MVNGYYNQTIFSFPLLVLIMPVLILKKTGLKLIYQTKTGYGLVILSTFFMYWG